MSRAQCLLALMLLAGCLGRVGGDVSDRHGWFRLHEVGPNGSYDDRFERLGAFLDQVPCAELAKEHGDPQKPIFVVLHGAGGEGPEMKKSVPLLVDSRPAAVYALRWSPWSRRDVLVSQVATGLSRLAECVPGSSGRIVVLAHSAGGVLASLASGHVVPPPGAPQNWLTVLTVAAPLSGALRGSDEGPEAAFILDLANTPAYPRPAAGVRVVHLRTDLPGDLQMTPIAGRAPNDLRVGVPGAPQIDLPRTLSHAGALVYISRHLADGGFSSWLEGQAPATGPQQARGRGQSLSTQQASGRRPDTFRPRTELFHW